MENLGKIRAALSDGSLQCKEIVEHYLENIQKHSGLNAFLEVYEAEALERASVIQEKINQKKQGKLAGMIIGIKDNLAYKGHQLTAGSKILAGFESVYSAHVIEKLLREDAIIIGRLNCDEFAMGSSNENSAWGNVKNGIATDRVPGGSSGGSAVAVQMDMCLVSLGSDTGGSIRQPASFCGIWGLKPTYGRVSRYGLVSYASSFDQIGPFAKNADDLAAVMEIIAGHDQNDATSADKPVPDYLQKLQFDKKTKVAVLEDCINAEGVETAIRDGIHTVREQLEKHGHQFNQADFPFLDYVVPVYQILSNAEASSNLSRYAGMIYGHRSEKATDVDSTIRLSRTEGFGEEVKRRIMLGTFVLSAGYYDAYYAKAQKVRRVVRDHLYNILEENEFIILPSTPTVPFKTGEKTQDPIAMYLQDIFTLPASIAGLPAISIPVGKDAQGFPYGLQVIGRPFSEDKLLAFSKHVSQICNDHS